MDDDHPSTSTNLEIDQLSPISLDPVNELKEELPPTQLQISSSSPYESTPSSSLSIAPLFSHSTSTRKTYSTSPISYQRRSSLIGSQEDANLELSDEGGSFTLAGLDSLDPSSVESSHAVSIFQFTFSLFSTFFAFVYFYYFDWFSTINILISTIY